MPVDVSDDDLLQLAERELMEAVVPHLSGRVRVSALKVASAIRMAVRESAQSEIIAHVAAELCPDRNARDFVRRIRAGEHDGDPVVHATLWVEAVARASVARPSMLSRVERRIARIPE
jgi:hypothetical protein